MGKNFWMIVESPENFEITRDVGFTLYGFGEKYRRRAERMQPDDRVLFYVKEMRKWTATATIASRYFEDNRPMWKPNSFGEQFRYRVKLSPDIILEEKDYIDALILAPRLEYVKKWLPEDWPLAFHESLHLLPQRDFRLIESEMKRLIPRNRRGANRHRSDRRGNRQPLVPVTDDAVQAQPSEETQVDETPDQSATDASSAGST